VRALRRRKGLCCCVGMCFTKSRECADTIAVRSAGKEVGQVGPIAELGCDPGPDEAGPLEKVREGAVYEKGDCGMTDLTNRQIRTLRWMVRDPFRQSLAYRFWVRRNHSALHRLGLHVP